MTYQQLHRLRCSLFLFLCGILLTHINHAQTFQNPKRLPAGSYVQTCCLADLDGDGRTDILEVGTNTLLPHFNLGGGNFRSGSTTVLSDFSGSTARPMIADVNGDGRPDVIMAGPAGGGYKVEVLLTNGDGTFSAPIVSTLTNVRTTSYDFAYTMVAGQFLGTGKVDLLVQFQSSGYGNTGANLLRGDGQGHFSYNSSVAFSAYAAVAIDLNGDGKVDLVSDGGGAAYALNNGGGTFQPQQTVSNNTTAFGALDQDGSHVFIAATDDTHATVTRLDAGGNATTTTISVPGITGVFGIADVNGDGIPDLLTRYRGLSVLLGQGGMRFSAPISQPGFTGNYLRPFSDMDGDNKLDLVYPNSYEIDLLTGRGDGSFATATQYAVGATVQDVTTADFNGDGNADVAVTVNGPSPVVLAGNGTGLTAPQTAPQSAAIVQTVSTQPLLVTGDFNGDGKPDLLQQNLSTFGGSSILFLGRGDGSFQAGASTPTFSTIVADFNNDRRTDILSSSSQGSGQGGSLISYLGQTDGTFRTVTTAFTDSIGGQALVGDFNHDGKLDASVYSFPLSTYVATGNGDGTFSSLAAGALGSTFRYTGRYADFDGDGISDLVCTQDTAYLILYGEKDGSFTPGATFSAGSQLAIGDLNHDGLPDIVSVNAGVSSNMVYVFRNLGKRTFATPDTYLFGGSKGTLADTNHDGLLDIVVTSGDTLTVLLNLGDARAVTGTLTFNPEPSQVGQSVLATAVFRAKTGTAPLTGSVNFVADGTTFATVPLANGMASANFTPATSYPYTIQVRATYSGDANYQETAVLASHVVDYKTTQPTLTLTVSPTAALRSTTLRLAATLAASGVTLPQGTALKMRFTSDGVMLGSATINTDGRFYLDVNTLPAGTHVMDAVFDGAPISQSTKLLPVSSPPVTVIISAHATATALTLSSGSGSAGTPVTLTATVSSTDASSPFGSVTFFDTSQPVATVLLQGGAASLTAASSTTGTHRYTASFNATETYAASSSSSASYTASMTTATFTPAIAMQSQPVDAGHVRYAAAVGTHGTLSNHLLSLVDGQQVLATVRTDEHGDASVVMAADTASHSLQWIAAADKVIMSGQSPLMQEQASDTSAFELQMLPARASLSPSQTLSLTAALHRTDAHTASVAWTCTTSTPQLGCSANSAGADRGAIVVDHAESAGRRSVPWIVAALLLPVCMLRRRTVQTVLLAAAACLAVFGASGCGRATQPDFAVVSVQAVSEGTVHTQQVLLELRR